jgi:5-deoxy-glucuronate isomerase
VRTLAARGRDTRLIDLQLVELESDERFVLADDGEVCAVVLSGAVDVTAAGAHLGLAARAGDVFDTVGDAVYVPPATELVLEAREAAVVVVAAAPVQELPSGEARLLPGREWRTRQAGEANWSRTIRTILGPEDAAGRLVVGETLNPSGNWSSYPPHKHDRQAPPEEVELEEVYFYRFRPASGFGVQLLYDEEHERAQVVHDGDALPIPSGYHPVVAAPGYELYYLWVMAGESRELAPFFDPQHAWIQQR